MTLATQEKSGISANAVPACVPAGIEALHVQHSELSHWLKANALEKVGTVEYLLTHRLLTDLIAKRRRHALGNPTWESRSLDR